MDALCWSERGARLFMLFGSLTQRNGVVSTPPSIRAQLRGCTRKMEALSVGNGYGKVDSRRIVLLITITVIIIIGKAGFCDVIFGRDSPWVLLEARL